MSGLHQLKENACPEQQNEPTITNVVLGPEQIQSLSGKEPVTFRLPHFTPDVEHSLRQKQSLNPAQRRNLIDTLFQAMIIITLYPSRRFYTTVGATLVGVHSHLRDTLGSGYDSWVALLRTKFKNRRRSMETAEVMTKKAIHGKREIPQQVSTSESTPEKLRRVDVLEDKFSGEDELSIEMHKTWLKKEFEKRKPDADQVAERMRITFADRQKILQEKPINECLEAYPFLRNEKQLLKDFEAVTGKDIDGLFLSGLNKYGQSILANLSTPSKRRDIQTLHKDTTIDDDTKKYRLAIAAIEVLVNNFKEDRTVLVTNEEEITVLTPVLKYTGRNIYEASVITLYVEKEPLMETTDFIIGLECLLATYWLFNLKYAAKVYNTLTVLEILLLKLSYTKPRVTTVRAISRIERGTV